MGEADGGAEFKVMQDTFRMKEAWQKQLQAENEGNGIPIPPKTKGVEWGLSSQWVGMSLTMIRCQGVSKTRSVLDVWVSVEL